MTKKRSSSLKNSAPGFSIAAQMRGLRSKVRRDKRLEERQDAQRQRDLDKNGKEILNRAQSQPEET